ncbi:MAG: hypothetical protein JST04_14980 [Bdellovibrionales bacterium]|nr:hypothetical protein [Bdellovibrionales bacterium]
MFARYRKLAAEAKSELKRNGFRSLFRKYGWKLVALVFTTYLVRDIALYIVLPWLVSRNLLAD